MDLLLGSEVTVSSQLDVTSQQHVVLMGQNGAHFLSVMHQTQTQIILPDLSAPQSPPSLLIQGSPDGVCLARQQLMVHFSLGRTGTIWLLRGVDDFLNLKPLLSVIFTSRTACLCV